MRAALRKLLREPLLHFVVAGAVLFAGYELTDRGEVSQGRMDPIHIGQGEVRWLRETFANQWRRAPTSEELSELVAGLVEEELLAREARTLGLDRDDTIVRRRLAQKLTFLVEDTSRIGEASEEELRSFYSANIERFRTEPRATFTQIFFDPGRRKNPTADALAMLMAFESSAKMRDAASLGDPLLLESSFQDINRQALSNLFGAEFAGAVFGLAPGSWSGPIRSGYGIHLVEVTEFSSATPLPFEVVRAEIMEEWHRQRQDEMKASYLAKLREKYGLVVEGSVEPLLSSPTPRTATQ